MLFYERVHLIADYSMVEHLVHRCGPELLLALLDEGFLALHYQESLTAVKTEYTGTSQERHWPVTARPQKWILQEAFPHIFQQVLGKSGKGRRLGNRFAERIHRAVEGEEVFTSLRADYANAKYVKEGIKCILQCRVPEYHLPNHFRFHVLEADEKYFVVDTNLDFVQQNGTFQLKVPSGLMPISPASLLVDLFEARRDLYYSSFYSGEIATNPISSALIRVKCDDLLRARQRSDATIHLFQEQVLEHGHCIRDVINSGERNYKDVLQLLQASRKFRHWLHQQEPDIDLIEAYYNEVTKSTWVVSLPAKVFRWLILSAVSVALIPVHPAVSIGVGSALSAADSFLVERLAEGWKPNQFVEGSLHKFVEQEKREVPRVLHR